MTPGLKRKMKVIRPDLEPPGASTPPEPAPAPRPGVPTTAFGLLRLRLRMWQRAARAGHAEFVRAPRALRLAREAACARCDKVQLRPGCKRGKCGLKGCGCEDIHAYRLVSTCPLNRWPDSPPSITPTP